MVKLALFTVATMDYKEARSSLIEHLRREISDEQVLSVMERVPRHLFVPDNNLSLAYKDMPLPIGEGQTISQPFIVALMTQALELTGSEKVLEIGTGCGYQAAILAELAQQVISVERYPKLAEQARITLDQLGYTNIEIHLAQKTLGWPEEAPYDAIMVTAGAPQVPQELINQLAEKGRMVIPVGSHYEQELVKLVKKKGQINTTHLCACRFVPLIGEGAWKESL